jgi:hypothetical protein
MHCKGVRLDGWGTYLDVRGLEEWERLITGVCHVPSHGLYHSAEQWLADEGMDWQCIGH